MWSQRKRYFLWALGILLLGFLLLNILAASHAYKFSHFIETNPDVGYTDTHEVTLTELILGMDLNKPQNTPVDLDFIEVDTIFGAENLEIWRFDMEPSLGVVALFHGYHATKSSLWKEALAFYRMGYSVVLVDFRAAGSSTGNTCSLGYFEAEDVRSTFNYCRENFPNKELFLYGSSMGAAAISRAVAQLAIEPQGILLQSAFPSMLGAVKQRFKMQGIPSFPSAQLVTFWGGYLNHFDALKHNPEEYATQINCPTLIIHGMLDDRVSFEDTKAIYNQISGPKQLAVFGNSGHESILNKEEPNWVYLVTNFMESHHH